MGVHKDKKTGNWYIRVKHYGREFQKVIGKDKRSAEIALAEVKLEIKTAKLAGQGWEGSKKFQKAVRPKTFREAAEEYMEERQHFKASSVRSYNAILRSHLIPNFGTKPLKEITESTIRKFQSGLVKDGTSPSRVNTITQLLRSILSQSYRRGEISLDPTLAVKRLQEPKVLIDPLSDTELYLALQACDPHFRPMFTVLAYTGARPNELQALRWSDIDWKKETISISKGRVRGVEGLPKTKSSERKIPFTVPVKEALTELAQRHKAQTVVSLDDYVFTTKRGGPINKHLDKVWKRALAKAQLRHRPAYQLRHTFVTHCIMKGFPLPFIAKIIGHSTIDTLIRHYAGWIDAATNENESKLREAFAASESRAIEAARESEGRA